MSDANPNLVEEKKAIWQSLASAAFNDQLTAQEVCKRWSEFAEKALSITFYSILAELEIKTPVALFALGKLGAEELNLSSDVDILIVAREQNDKLSKIARELSARLHNRLDGSLILRVDFDLRPGGKASPLVSTAEQFMDYYGNFGETWERMAFVRLRQLAGDQELGKEILSFVERYSYRRYLDYRLFEDLRALREKIQSYVVTEPGCFNLKLSEGGIRDIELFVHAIQVIHGGKRPELRTNSTDLAIKKISLCGLLAKDEGELLISHYWQLRALENYVQSLHEQQTHLFYFSRQHSDWVMQTWSQVERQLPKVQKLIGSFVGSLQKHDSQKDLSGHSDPDLEQFKNELMLLPVLSRNKEGDLRIREQFINSFLPKLKKQSQDFEKSLAWLKDFLIATKAKGQILSLLVSQPQLQEHLAVCFARSGFLSRTLIHHPDLLDSILLGSQQLDATDPQSLLEQCSERKLLTEFVGGMDFLLHKDLPRLHDNLSQCADSICDRILNHLNLEFNTQIQILCLGKWGGRELGFNSDLDFIFVTKSTPNENDQKVARRFLSYLQQNHSGAPLYSFDLRLKPQSSVLIVEYQALVHHLTEQAQIWERQAYLKARWMGQTKPAMLADAYIKKPVQKKDLVELWRIQTSLFQNQKGDCDLKYSPGGMLDIELCLQTKILMSGKTPSGTSTADFFNYLPDNQKLKEIYQELNRATTLLRLHFESSIANLTAESIEAIVGANQSPNDLLRYYENQLKQSWELLKVIDPRRT